METKIEIDMFQLMDYSIFLLDYTNKEIEKGHNIPKYENLESLIQESLESLYNIEFDDCDETKEIILDISESLLVWCKEKFYIDEYKKLEKLH